jgi:hypothetical protein
MTVQRIPRMCLGSCDAIEYLPSPFWEPQSPGFEQSKPVHRITFSCNFLKGRSSLAAVSQNPDRTASWPGEVIDGRSRSYAANSKDLCKNTFQSVITLTI